MKKKSFIAGFILILVVLATSGCFDFLKNEKTVTTYTPSPVEIHYSISYGYRVTCRGTGEFDIEYDCDLPEILVGEVTSIRYLNNDCEEKNLVNNSMVSWNLTGKGNKNYNLGITADIVARGYVVSDLDGKGALTVQEISEQHHNILEQYGHAQANETTVFIDPNDPSIKITAQGVLYDTASSNSFIIAKNLFIWLKDNTYYKPHSSEDENIQTASVTKRLRYGDCDDLSFLYISLCRSVGIPARFIRGFTVRENENGYVEAVPHAWVEVFVGGDIGNDGWIPVECACNSSDMQIQVHQNFAIETADHLRLFIDQGSNESFIVSISGIKAKYEKNKMVVEIESIDDINSYDPVEKKELRIDENNQRYYI